MQGVPPQKIMRMLNDHKAFFKMMREEQNSREELRRVNRETQARGIA